jgi:hypothetical protein
VFRSRKIQPPRNGNRGQGKGVNEMLKENDVWVDLGENEVHIVAEEPVTICIGSTSTLIIEKLYGPAVESDLRIKYSHADNGWKIEIGEGDDFKQIYPPPKRGSRK